MKRVLIVLALWALVAAGCGRKPESGGTPGGAASTPPASAASNLVMARVGDHTITAEDLRNHMLKASTPENVDNYLKSPDIVQVALASLVDQFVWSEMARREGFKLTEGERHQVDALEAEFLATRYVGDVVQGKARPSREEVEEFYSQNQHEFLSPPRVAVRHILVGTEVEARRLLAEAAGGADFAGLARRFSKDEGTREAGGVLGFVQAKSEIPGIGRNDAFAEKVLSMNPGNVDLFPTQQGWHVIKVDRKEGGDLLPLDQVYEKIETPMLKQRFAALYNDELNRARDEVGVSIDSNGFEKLTGVPHNCDRLMDMGNQADDAMTRVELYRRVSADFPDCARAPQAQFMIGYLQLTQLENRPAARKALMRLQSRFGGSDWRKAGDYLLEHLDDDPAGLGTPEEIFAKATR